MATLQNEIAMGSLQLAENLQANGFDSHQAVSGSTPFGSFTLGGAASAMPAAAQAAQAPASPPAAPASIIHKIIKTIPNSSSSSSSSSSSLPGTLPIVSNAGMSNGQSGQWLTYANGQSIFAPYSAPVVQNSGWGGGSGN